MTMHDDTDRLNEALIAVEAALGDLRLGVSAHVAITGTKYTLGFEKHGDLWRLTVADDVGTNLPLVQASRLARVRATHHLVSLHILLRQRYDEQRNDVAEAIQAAEAFLDRLAK
jgi:hypothetical protein